MANGNTIAGGGVWPNKSTPLLPGSRSDAAGGAVNNRILLALPDEEYQQLRPILESVELPQYDILHDVRQKIDFAYFLNRGMCSVVALNGDGRSVEVGMVGKEGVVGLELTAGLGRAAFRAIMQVSGNGLRVRAEVFQEVLANAPALRSELSRFSLIHGLYLGQIAACNRLHEITQRLARWVLMCQDRVDSPTLALTHEFLGQMLGTGRPSVTLAAGALEDAGLIENLRGTVRIVNRKALEEAACECYSVIQNFNGGLGLK